LRNGGNFYSLFDDALPNSVFLAKNFPQMERMMFKAILKRDPFEAILYVAYMGGQEKGEACRQFNARRALEEMLKDAPVIAKANGIEVKKGGNILHLFSKGQYLYHETLNGISPKEHAEKMVKTVVDLRRKGKH